MSLYEELEIGRAGVCSACLTFVAFPLDDGDLRTAKREARKMAPILWSEGLAEPALAAMRRATARHVPGAAEALADLERDGGGSAAAREIVLRLASDMVVEMRAARAALRN